MERMDRWIAGLCGLVYVRNGGVFVLRSSFVNAFLPVKSLAYNDYK